RIEANGPRSLDSSMGVRRAGKLYATTRLFRKLSKAKLSVIEQVRIATPMLLILVALGQQPKLIATVVEPLVVRRLHVLSCEFRIDEQIIMPVEAYLHEASAILRHDNELHPPIGNLLCFPPFVIN